MLGIDVDGVLADQTSQVLLQLNKRFGKSFTAQDWTDWEAGVRLYDIPMSEVLHEMDWAWC